MILQHHEDATAFITQIEHARLSGKLARHWGNDEIPQLPSWDELVTATTRHDDGWAEYDAAPSIDEHGNIRDFLTTTMAQRVEIYRQGVDAVSEEPPDVRLLVSMHLTGLFRGRYEPGNPGFIQNLEGDDRELAFGFVEQEEASQTALRKQVSYDPLAHYRLLQLFDRLSLAFCMQPVERLTKTTIEYVPLNGDQDSMDMWGEEDRLILDPFPYDDTVDVSLNVSRIAPGPWSDEAAVAEALAGAPTETQHFQVAGPT